MNQYKSNQIADKLKIRHDHFCTRINEEFSQLDWVNVTQSDTAGGRPQKIYFLEQKHLFQLQRLFPRNEIAQELYEKLIEELFQPKQETYIIPKTYGDALIEAGRLANENKKLTAQLLIAEPKANAYDKFMDAEGDFLPSSAAKALQIQPQKLFFDLLRLNGYAFQRGEGKRKHWVATASAIKSGYLIMKVGTHSEPEKGSVTHEQMYVTAKGMGHFAKKFGMKK